MQDIEKKYRGYIYILGRDDYADDPKKPFNSWVYKNGELLDGGGDFETMEEAEDMAKSTIDGYSDYNNFLATCPVCNKVNSFDVTDEEYEANCWYSCTYCEHETQIQNYQQIDNNMEGVK